MLACLLARSLAYLLHVPTPKHALDAMTRLHVALWSPPEVSCPVANIGWHQHLALSFFIFPPPPPYFHVVGNALEWYSLALPPSLLSVTRLWPNEAFGVRGEVCPCTFFWFLILYLCLCAMTAHAYSVHILSRWLNRRNRCSRSHLNSFIQQRRLQQIV